MEAAEYEIAAHDISVSPIAAGTSRNPGRNDLAPAREIAAFRGAPDLVLFAPAGRQL